MDSELVKMLYMNYRLLVQVDIRIFFFITHIKEKVCEYLVIIVQLHLSLYLWL